MDTSGPVRSMSLACSGFVQGRQLGGDSRTSTSNAFYGMNAIAHVYILSRFDVKLESPILASF